MGPDDRNLTFYDVKHISLLLLKISKPIWMWGQNNIKLTFGCRVNISPYIHLLYGLMDLF